MQTSVREASLSDAIETIANGIKRSDRAVDHIFDILTGSVKTQSGNVGNSPLMQPGGITKKAATSAEAIEHLESRLHAILALIESHANNEESCVGAMHGR